MLYYERIDISKGIDPTKNNKNKKCVLWHYWFFNHEFKFQDSVCNCGYAIVDYRLIFITLANLK